MPDGKKGSLKSHLDWLQDVPKAVQIINYFWSVVTSVTMDTWLQYAHSKLPQAAPDYLFVIEQNKTQAKILEIF